MDSAQFYLRLKHLIHSIDQDVDLADLDLVSMRILEIASLRYLEKKPMTVSEVMALEDLASPATLHRKLDGLRDAELLLSFNLGADKRTKFLRPSPKAMSHFSKLSNVLELSLQRTVRT
jgi:DNA-binding MarR family transcriptional regulator